MKGPEQRMERHEGTWQQEIYTELKLLARVLTVVILVFQFAAQLIIVVGGSMFPTLHERDILLATRIHRELKTGDVVIVHKETPVIQETVVKRVIATGGQTIQLDYERNLVYVDGVALDEPYINPDVEEDGGDPMLPRGDVTSMIVPEGCVFVMGDNRNHSTDSRFTYELGYIDEGYVTGKALVCFFPLNHIKVLA